MEGCPKVSIGLPVYNGERYLRNAIESILAQTFTDFELILSDNASTDSTPAICQEYAAKDSRIRYVRNQQNIGGINNYNQTINLSRGQYFHLAAHDDLLAPESLARCVAILETRPAFVLCYSAVRTIDEAGAVKTIMAEQGLAASPNAYHRFQELLTQFHECEAVLGLIRADVLRQTQLHPNFPKADYGFLCELSLYGPFYHLPEPLYLRRGHQSQSCAAPSTYSAMAWYQPTTFEQKNPSIFNLVQVLLNYYWIYFAYFTRIIYASSLTLSEKLLAHLTASRWLLKRLLLDESRAFRQKIFLTKENLLAPRSLFRKSVESR